jgi:hypothetical protein
VSTQTPPPGPDFTKLARRPTERLAIVPHVFATTSLQETEYLEWKIGYDLSAKTGVAGISKHLTGFANRDFGQAARHAGGHAYLLLGVEPGNLAGVPVWDSADIENWLARFNLQELVPIIVNETDDNFEDAVVELTLPFNCDSSTRVHAKPSRASTRQSGWTVGGGVS